MKAGAVDLAAATAEQLVGRLVCRNVVDPAGATVVRKGRVLDAADADRLVALAAGTVHVAVLDPDEIHEEPAGRRIAAALVGDGVELGSFAGGYWPLVARRRGILAVASDRLREVNGVEGVACCTLFDGQVVDAGELVARVKVVPFALAECRVAEAEARAEGGLLGVEAFRPVTVGAVVAEHVARGVGERFEAALSHKLDWMGATLLPVRYVEDDAGAVAAALESLAGEGAELVVTAGSRSMDPLDPTLEAVARVGGRMLAHGAAAFPGTLLWMARFRSTTVLGLPSCGIFSKATVVDLLLPRWIARGPEGPMGWDDLGHGGLLRPEGAYGLPPYREGEERGRV